MTGAKNGVKGKGDREEEKSMERWKERFGQRMFVPTRLLFLSIIFSSH